LTIVLDRVLGVGGVADERCAVAVELLVVALEDRFEGAAAAADCTPRQVRIAGRKSCRAQALPPTLKRKRQINVSRFLGSA
jgi:hypothetical protein